MQWKLMKRLLCRPLKMLKIVLFNDQITVFNAAIQDFSSDEKFDCIITNPPFFQSDLKSPDAKINLAHHADSLYF